MPQIKYIEWTGDEHDVEVPEGWSLMEGATKNDVPGIDAECMGGCACATCHVYLEPRWIEKLAAPSETEAALLEYAEGVKENSRLSCQIKVVAEMDGMVVRIPQSQK